MDLVHRPARAVRGDADITTCFDLFRQQDESAQAFLWLRAGAARGFKSELSAGIRDDLAVPAWAAQNSAWDVREPEVVQVGKHEHAVVPEGPDFIRPAPGKNPRMILDFEAQSGADAPNEPCHHLAEVFDAYLRHVRACLSGDGAKVQPGTVVRDSNPPQFATKRPRKFSKTKAFPSLQAHSAKFLRDSSELMVRNLPENLALVEFAYPYPDMEEE